MPPGFDSAFACYVPETHTLHMNPELLASNKIECAYHFLHEMRHAKQYLVPEAFPDALVKGLSYVIQYDGQCYKQVDGKWLGCHLPGEEACFTELYLAQPHDLDAGDFAFRILEALADESERAELNKLHASWQPPYRLIFQQDMATALKKAYRAIDLRIRP